MRSSAHFPYKVYAHSNSITGFLCSNFGLHLSMMWPLSLYLFLAFGSESSLLPKPSTSQPSLAPPTAVYTEVPPPPLPTTIFISTSPATSKPQSQIKESAAAPIQGDPPSPLYNHPFSKTLQPANPMNTLLPSTVTVLSPSVHPSTSLFNQALLPMPTIAPPINPPTLPTFTVKFEVPCLYEYRYSCQVKTPIRCRCNEPCQQFGDCCSDSNHVHNTNIPKFECVSNSVLNGGNAGEYYWMIASCPEDETNSEVLNKVENLCEAQSLSSPPVTDKRTGLVYRNVHCAQCNNVPDTEQIIWPSEWLCNDALLNTLKSSGGTVDIDVLLAACNPSIFKEPPWISDKKRAYPLRQCDGSIIYKCQPPPGTNTSSEEYRVLERFCRNKPGKARTITTAPGVYKNEYCALCSSPDMNRSNLQCPPEPLPPIMSGIVTNSFALVLDVTGSGIAVLSMENIRITSTIEQSCTKGQVFDVYRKMCRESPCQLGYSYSGSRCLPTASNCTLVALNSTEYQTVSNQIIFWFALEQNVSVEGYNSDGNPLVCTNFTSNFTRTVNETITRVQYGYPAAFAILTYLGLSVDVVAASILLFTYAAFAVMRTFYGKLFMNFVLVLLLGDLTFLLGEAVYGVSLEDVVCQVVAILLHYLFLARFVWMSLLSLNVARHFYHAVKFIINEERESWCYLVLYMAAGWLSPLLVLIVTVPLNYSVSGTVGYGVDGLCWMNQTLAIIVSFIVPLAICILFTIGAFVFVCIILVKLHNSDVNEDLQHKTGSRNCRVLIAVFCVTGATWLFGFLALIDSALSWAWYIFIILNTTQAVFLTLAYICTAKVLRLYRTAFVTRFQHCARKNDSKVPIAQQTTQLELLQSSMPANTMHS